MNTDDDYGHEHHKGLITISYCFFKGLPSYIHQVCSVCVLCVCMCVCACMCVFCMCVRARGCVVSARVVSVFVRVCML
ncbi:MAG: hypothetical protein P4L40_16940 [Terracidiphilus sp.]|nr:hypothetical protein [Terracidiphilus sp.]